MNKDIKKYTDFEKLYEFKIPNVKLDEFLYNLKFANKKHRMSLLKKFNTFEQYVDLIDKKKHMFKINDLSGDILNSERVVFKTMVFDRDDVEIIKNNIVTFALSEFYTDIPDTLNIFGIQLKPISFIDKDAVRITFGQTITFDQTLTIIADLSHFTYEGELDGNYIWSDKKKEPLNQSILEK